MPTAFPDLCGAKGTTQSPATTINLDGADISGLRNFGQAVTDGDLSSGDTVFIMLEDASGNRAVWEATFTDAAPDTLTRVTELATVGSAIGTSIAVDVRVVNPGIEMVRQLGGVVLEVNGSGASDQGISANAYAKVAAALSATADVDTISGWDGTNKRYTPPVAGKYFFWGQFVSNSLGAGDFVIGRLRKNGTTAFTGARVWCHGGGDQESGIAMGVFEMNGTTDYVELLAYISGSGTETVRANGATYIQAMRISR